MKAAINGALHLSTMDGWWAEAYDREAGWSIGAGEEYDDPDYQDEVEAQALYNVLEDEVIPAFYDRDANDIPDRWIAMMRASIRLGLGSFTSHRMLLDYNRDYYQPALALHDRLISDGGAGAGDLHADR